MKRYLFFTLSAFLLAACQASEPNSAPQSSSASSVVAESASSESVASTEIIALFDETFKESSTFPKTSVPLSFTKEEMMQAIVAYYQENYIGGDREANLSPIPAETLQDIETFLKEDEALKALNAKVREIQFKLGEDDVYVAQIIVPMKQEMAEQQVADNAIHLLNGTFTHLGNRLVMISYYDQETKVLLPAFLTNRTHPLFTYIEE